MKHKEATQKQGMIAYSRQYQQREDKGPYQFLQHDSQSHQPT